MQYSMVGVGHARNPNFALPPASALLSSLFEVSLKVKSVAAKLVGWLVHTECQDIW
jgi:hypothetical protein